MGRGSWVEGRGSWVAGCGRGRGLLVVVVGRGDVGRESWVVVIVGRRLSTRWSVIGRRSCVGRESWAVIDVDEVVGRGSCVVRGSWVVGRGSWVVGHGSWVVGRGRGSWLWLGGAMVPYSKLISRKKLKL